MQKITAAAPNGEAPPGYPISSVDNALRLLLAFRSQPRLRLTEASGYLGVAHSTAHRLLAMLAYHGFVRQESGTRSYVAGPALVEVGLAVIHRMDIRSYARPVLKQLSDRFGETSYLAVLEGSQVRYLDSVESDKALRVASRTGMLLEAHGTSVGKAMLAELSPEEFRELYPIGTKLHGESARSIDDVAELEREIKRVAQRGYALNQSESEEGVASVAVAVHALPAAAVASLSVATPESRMNSRLRKEIAEALRESAEQLGASLPGSA